MKLNYAFKHLDVSEALTEYTHKKLDEIGRFLLKEGHGQVTFSKNQFEFIVELSVNTRQKYFKASAHCDDAYMAVDQAIDKLEKQFLKVRSRFHKQHHKPEIARLKKAA